jgi:hypothetical protein
LNKNKTIWDTVKLETNQTRNTDKTSILNVQGTSVRNHQVRANEFNKYFSSIAKDLNRCNKLGFYNPENITPLHYLLQSFKTPFPNFKLNFVTSKEIVNIIKSLKPKNSSGYDGISTTILK